MSQLHPSMKNAFSLEVGVNFQRIDMADAAVGFVLFYIND